MKRNGGSLTFPGDGVGREQKNYQNQNGFASAPPFTPDFAGHEARLAAARTKRNRIAWASVIIAIIAVLAIVFALYTFTDLFTSTDPVISDLTLDGAEEKVTLSVVDHTAFEAAVTAEDYKGLGGQDMSVWIQPYLIGYKVTIHDTEVARVANGALYGWAPGVTQVDVYTADNKLVDSFFVYVADADGNVYYSVEFYKNLSDTTPIYAYSVISGKTFCNAERSLPAYPQKVGYTAAGWAYNGAAYDGNEAVTATKKVYCTWTPKNVAFISSETKVLAETNYKDNFTLKLADYIDAGSASGSFGYAQSDLPGFLSLDSASGVISGKLEESGTYNFDITAYDGVQTAAEKESTKATKSFVLTVAPRVASIVLGEGKLVYNGAKQTITAQIINLDEGDIGLVQAKLTYNGVAEGMLDADNYTVTVSGLEGRRADNYELPSRLVSRVITVEPLTAQIAFAAAGATDFRFVYDSLEHNISATVANLCGTDTCEVTLSYLGDAVNYASAGVVATAQSLSNPNYKLPTVQQSKRYYIDKAVITVTANSMTKAYGDDDPEVFDYTIAGAYGLDEDVIKDYINDNKAIYYVGSSVGIYEYGFDMSSLTSAYANAALKNYTFVLSDDSSRFTISKRNVSIESITKVYDASTSTDGAVVTFNGVIDGDVLAISGAFATANVGEDIAIGNVTLTVGNENYQLIGNSFVGSITPKTITAIDGVVSIFDKTYDQTLSAEIDFENSDIDFVGICAGDVLELLADANFVSSAVAGNVKVELSDVALAATEDAANYVLADNLDIVNIFGNIVPIVVYKINGIKGLDKVFDNSTAASIDITEIAFCDANGVSCVLKDESIVLNFNANFASASVGEDITITLTSLSLSGLSVGNYVLAENVVIPALSGDILAGGAQMP